jgi:hypothetical protein
VPLALLQEGPVPQLKDRHREVGLSAQGECIMRAPPKSAVCKKGVIKVVCVPTTSWKFDWQNWVEPVTSTSVVWCVCGVGGQWVSRHGLLRVQGRG